jgi:hypothetical protein
MLRLTDHDPGTPIAVVGVRAQEHECSQLRGKQHACDIEKHGVDYTMLVKTKASLSILATYWEATARPRSSSHRDTACSPEPDESHPHCRRLLHRWSEMDFKYAEP